jgi:hypothetical protein
MLVKLMPDQIAENWELFSRSLSLGLPPGMSASPERMNDLLTSLLSGIAILWAGHSYDKKEDKSTVHTIIMTTVIVDPISDMKSLYIYAAVALHVMEMQEYVDMYNLINRYAKASGCERIITYTSNERLAEVLKKYDALTDFRFVSLDVI